MAADGEVAHIVQSVSRFLGDVNKKIQLSLEEEA